ncbi:MAG: MurR/RpiR family transcriptional regulator [Liquorilactobacillus nagelii]|jgi:DNA-binding MurR/RpiR family transcriptional regulator|uniref:RpiR family transcriptional regulator n=3 Tax=Liquorilactobacillus nagelii TaxID=82688 RepID=A0A3Q8CDH7_9LACO|nr:MurR/RpiR family transcriptional regulator [Liquorilactobacillus nagelii]AUJ32815.1 RpiR family transcriptional regulator [Liquorilactobacillus nagelii]MCC7616970.1 RpiR family transcriptional regulator [Liquorilactobacillus nagelii]MCI1700694.1 MurR/RpiR family transcriptional regulator [Liquorilactobacillus nagelii]MCP9315759.1 MurR/RpiR family transcriptional regulator [Liquorilactobacillus nagelii]
MSSENVIDMIYSNLSAMTQTDKKIAQSILKNPGDAVNYTISELASKSSVSEASVSRFCKNLQLTGFHQLKIELAKVSDDESSYYKVVNIDNIQQAITNIKDNKNSEISNTLASIDTSTIKKVMKLIESSRIFQIAAEGNTFPVVEDASYRFNQIGILTICSESWETSIGQTLNLASDDVLMVISNSGESKRLLKQIRIAKKKGIKVIAITNRNDSPIALEAEYHLRTAVRQKVLQSEYYFSRVAAMTVVETIFLLLIAKDRKRLSRITEHEAIISDTKI